MLKQLLMQQKLDWLEKSVFVVGPTQKKSLTHN